MPSLTFEREKSQTNTVIPRVRSLPQCAICGEQVVAAESSALGPNGEVKYLWSCEACGHGFVTSFKAETCH